jgi:hypothetical protein
MFSPSWRRILNRVLPASRPASRRPRGPRLRCEELEPRLQPSGFFFSTGLPDGKIATITEPASAHTAHVEYESADDFALTTETVLQRASFTGLLTGGATPRDVSSVDVEIYRVFPNDSDVDRTSGAPTFSTDKVPTRVNSPSDVQLDARDSADHELLFHTRVLRASFTAQASVSSADKISVHSSGNGPVTGEEVQFEVNFKVPFDLPAGHYFFVPQVGLSGKAPAGADFLWLSAPKPIASPGTPFPAGVNDLQSWMRDDPPLAPDWLRIGTDIIGGTTFNASFSLSGHTVGPHISSLSQSSALEGSPDRTITIHGSNFTQFSTVVIDGLQPLATTFVSPDKLMAIIPADFLAEEGQFTISVLDSNNGESNSKTFHVTESVPAIDASVSQGRIFQDITLAGQVSDLAQEDHHVRINWGDGHVQTLDLPAASDGNFSVGHTFATTRHIQHDTIVVTPLDDEGVHGAPLTLDVIV